jgi:hypothetical protein
MFELLNLILDITWVTKEMILPFLPSYKLKKEQRFTQRTFHALIFRLIFVTDIQKLSNTEADFNFRVHRKGFNQLRSKTSWPPRIHRRILRAV